MLNKVILIGNLGRDPEIRYTSNQKAITKFSVATTESYKDKDGNRQKDTEWHNCTLFGKQADIAAEYLKKGSKVYLEGKIKSNKYKGKDNQEKYFTEIIVNNFQMLDKKEDRPAPEIKNELIGHEIKNTQPELAPVANESFDDEIPF